MVISAFFVKDFWFVPYGGLKLVLVNFSFFKNNKPDFYSSRAGDGWGGVHCGSIAMHYLVSTFF